MPFSLFKKKDPVSELTAKGLEPATCSIDCGSCDFDYPKSVSVDDGTLWNSTKEYDIHIVVPTGKTDWVHDPTSDGGTVVHSVSKWASSHKEHQVKVSVSSIGGDKYVVDEDYAAGRRGDLLILPFFVWVHNVCVKDVQEALDTTVPILAKARADKTQPDMGALAHMPQLSLEIDHSHAYVFLCSHRTRDKRCGITAPLMKRALETELHTHGMQRDASDASPGGVRVAYVNHVGGHKFAANLMVYLRTGEIIWLARIRPQHAEAVVKECIMGGRTWVENTRVAMKGKGISW